MRHTAEISDHHAEAVIERHRDAYPVTLGELHCLAQKEPVVQDIVVAEGGALWKPGRAAGELDVYRVVELQLFGERSETVLLSIAAETRHILEPQDAGPVSLADGDHQPQPRQP